jgi:hypothetical protein
MSALSVSPSSSTSRIGSSSSLIEQDPSHLERAPIPSPFPIREGRPFWIDPARLKKGGPSILHRRFPTGPLQSCDQTNPPIPPSLPPPERAHLNQDPKYQKMMNIWASWASLFSQTNDDPSIPQRLLSPSEYPHPPHFLTPIANLEIENQPWEICGNWMTNPFDPTHRIAVFEYPCAEQITDHWKLIHQYELELIDLTNNADLLNLGISKKKRPPFYPSPEGEVHNHCDPNTGAVDFQMRCASVNPPFHLYEITIPSETFTVPVLHYRDWNDGRAIPLESLDALVNYVLSRPRIGIHCRAGLGRTGVLVTAVFIKFLIQKNQLSKETFTLEWLNALILSLRSQRSQNWVHQFEQYQLLYEYGLKLLDL